MASVAGRAAQSLETLVAVFGSMQKFVPRSVERFTTRGNDALGD
jgi:hypothetical protein